MNKPSLSRNDPCPCGSGLKYKRCCLGRGEAPAGPAQRLPGMQGLFDDLDAAKQGREFRDMEGVKQFVDEFMRERNQSLSDDFDGLTPDQMHRFLHSPFECPELVRFNDPIDLEPTGPMPELFRSIVEAIDDKGLKLTPKGNLPRALTQAAARRVLGDTGYEKYTRIHKIRGEADFEELLVTRETALRAGLLRKRLGRIFRTKRCNDLMDSGSLEHIYPILLRGMARTFNWGYRDRFPDIEIIQWSFLFSLRLLSRHGGDWRGTSFYEESFVRAFPTAVAEVPEHPYSTPLNDLKQCYSVRTLERFAQFCGLVEVDPDPRFHLLVDRRVRKLPLLDAAVEFLV